MIIFHGSKSGLARSVRRRIRAHTHRRERRAFINNPACVAAQGGYTACGALDFGCNLSLGLPPPEIFGTAPPKYEDMYKFYRSNKRDQWHVLREYFRCPEINSPPYVIRPLQHEGGEGFQISQTLPDESLARTHYWRSLWRRSCEYRVLFAHGKPVVVLLKRVPEGTSQELAWNAGVSSYVTVHDPENDRLRHSLFYQKAEGFFKDYPFHFLAVDVLYRQQKHRVVEVNFLPGITIPANRDKLVAALAAPYITTCPPPN